MGYLPNKTNITINKQAPRKIQGNKSECSRYKLEPFQKGCLKPIINYNYHQIICCGDQFFLA